MKKKCARIPVLLCFAAVLLFFHTAACAKAEKTQLNKLKLTGISRGTAAVTASYGKRCVKCKVTVIGKNDYSPVLTENVIRKALSVPRQAKVTIKYGKKFYKRSFGATLVPVDVLEDGKKVAGASFFVKDGELGCNILNYGHYE